MSRSFVLTISFCLITGCLLRPVHALESDPADPDLITVQQQVSLVLATAFDAATTAPHRLAISSATVVATPIPKALTPQFPIQYMGVVGSTYMYQTDCCQVESHGGILYSDVYFAPTGCGVGGGLGGVDTPPVTGIPGSAGHAPATPKLGIGFFDGSFVSRRPKYPFLNAVANRNVCDIVNYYSDSPERFNTAIQLIPETGDAKWFSIVQVKVSSFDLKGVKVDHNIAMLVNQRPNPNLDTLNAAGDELEIKPTKKIYYATKVNVDFSTPNIKVLKLTLDKDGVPGTEEVDLVMVVRDPR